MKLGCCISDREQLAALAAAGGDYCELPLAALVMAGDEASFEELADRVSAAIPPLACHVFLPSGLTVVGTRLDADALERYVARAVDRAHRLGVHVLVFGSGRSRMVPDGFSREKALDQLTRFIDSAGHHCQRYGIALALEPLRGIETNLINSVAEGAAFLAERQPEGVTLLADLYHMMEEGESLGVLEECGDLLTHAHVADSGRRPPGQGCYPLDDFFERLHRAGYTRRCSIECRWEDFAAEVGTSLAYLRRAADAAGMAAV